MSETVEKLLPMLIALSPEDRADIAECLFSSLPDADENEQKILAELDRRLENHLNGRSPGVPADEVFRRLREKYP